MAVQRWRDTILARTLGARVPGAVTRGPRHDADRRPLLYLTVDDGPDADGTPRWIDALNRHGAHAVGFFSSHRAAAHRPLVRQWVAAGHRVGNHGERHESPWATRPRAMRASMTRAERVLTEIAREPVRDVRPPYGRVTPGLVRWCRNGRRLVLWDTMPGDYLAARAPEALAADLVRDARPGSVVVFHDGPPAARAVAALDLALPRLAAAGWRFPALPPP